MYHPACGGRDVTMRRGDIPAPTGWLFGNLLSSPRGGVRIYRRGQSYTAVLSPRGEYRVCFADWVWYIYALAVWLLAAGKQALTCYITPLYLVTHHTN